MLHHRHQLDVGEAAPHQVIRQPPGQTGVAPVVRSRPRSQVALVDRDGGVHPVALPAGRHPLAVAPVVPADVPDDRGRVGRGLGMECHRIRLLEHSPAVAGGDGVLVLHPGAHPVDPELPHPGRRGLHRMRPPVPAVEITDQRHPGGVGRPHPKPGAVTLYVGTEDLVEVGVLAGVEQPAIVGGE